MEVKQPTLFVCHGLHHWKTFHFIQKAEFGGERRGSLRSCRKTVGYQFSPIMEKLSRPRLKVSRPLSIVRFEHHTGQVSNLIRGVMSPRAELKHSQQTHQQPTSDHHSTKLTSINTHDRTRLVNLREIGDFSIATSSNVLNGSSAWTSRIRASYDYFCWSRDQRMTLSGLKKRVLLNIWTFIVKAGIQVVEKIRAELQNSRRWTFTRVWTLP